jgi:hypothetical protein
MSIQSIYDDAKEQKIERDTISPRFAAKIKRDGMNWSDDMDDATLRRYFVSTGIVKEKERRDRLLNEKEGHEFIFHYSGSLIDHTTPDDPNYRAAGYLLGLSYDYHLARITPDLKNWSAQISIELGANNYDMGGLNISSKETIYGAMLNYYFYNNPLSINRFIFQLGMGIKAGSALFVDSRLLRNYSYQVSTLPTAQLVGKYRFQVGDLNEETVKMGSAINFGISFDQKRLKIIDNPIDSINSDVTVNEIKLLIGLGLYF